MGVKEDSERTIPKSPEGYRYCEIHDNFFNEDNPCCSECARERSKGGFIKRIPLYSKFSDRPIVWIERRVPDVKKKPLSSKN